MIWRSLHSAGRAAPGAAVLQCQATSYGYRAAAYVRLRVPTSASCRTVDRESAQRQLFASPAGTTA